MREKRRQRQSYSGRQKEDRSWVWLCAVTAVLALFFIGLMVYANLKNNAAMVTVNNRNPDATEELTPEKFYPFTLKSLLLNPLSKHNYFNFIIDTGDGNPQDDTQIKSELAELIKYFFLGISLPPDEFWVNLNPVQPEKITAFHLGKTAIGKILLEADLRLKKDASRLTNPQTALGRKYWEMINEGLREQGLINTNIPGDNRLWIVPQQADVEEDATGFTIVGSSLGICLESEYLFRNDTADPAKKNSGEDAVQEIVSQAMEETIVPRVEYMVNYSRDYASLRQVYESLILAECYKQKYWGEGGFFAHCINQVYLDGLNSTEPWSKEEIFNGYMNSFRNGEYALYMSEYDPQMLDLVRKYYFSGGVGFMDIRSVLNITKIVPQTQDAASPIAAKGRFLLARVFNPEDPQNPWQVDGVTLSKSGEIVELKQLAQSTVLPPDTSTSSWEDTIIQQPAEKAEFQSASPIGQEETKLAGVDLRGMSEVISKQEQPQMEGVSIAISGNEEQRIAQDKGDSAVPLEKFIVPGARKKGDGYILDIPVSDAERKYQINKEQAEKYMEDIYRTTGIIDTRSGEMPAVCQRLNEIAGLLLKAAGLNPAYFVVHLLDSEKVEAFSLPYSNHIFVSTGLLEYLIAKGGSEDALAFIMAREVARILQDREEIDSGRARSLTTWAAIGKDLEQKYLNASYVDRQALELLEKCNEMTQEKDNFTVSQASFFFNRQIEDFDQERGPSQGIEQDIASLKIKELRRQVRVLETLMHDLYWRGYLKSPVEFSAGCKTEVQQKGRTQRFRYLSSKVESFDDFKDLLNQAATLEEIELLVLNTYERVQEEGVSIDLSVALEVVEQRIELLAAGSPQLQPYYKFIFTSLSRFTGAIKLDYEQQKQMIKETLKNLSVEQLCDLCKIPLPEQIAADQKKYQDYKRWFYQGPHVGDNQQTMIWLDAIMEGITEGLKAESISGGRLLELAESLEEHKKQAQQISGVNLLPYFARYELDIAGYLWKRIKDSSTREEACIRSFIGELTAVADSGFFQQGAFSRQENRYIAFVESGSLTALRVTEMLETVSQLSVEGRVTIEQLAELMRGLKGEGYESVPFLDSLHQQVQTAVINKVMDDLSHNRTGTSFKKLIAVFPGDPIQNKDLADILEALVSSYNLPEEGKLQFVKIVLEGVNDNLLEKHPEQKQTIHFEGALQDYARWIVLSVQQTPESEAFLNEQMQVLENERMLTGLTTISFPMQKLIYLFQIGSGLHPWTLREVIFGRDNAYKQDVRNQYQDFFAGGFDPFLYEYESTNYNIEDTSTRLLELIDEKDMRRIEQHSLYGVNFTRRDLEAFYRFLLTLPESIGARGFPTMKEVSPYKDLRTNITQVSTWDEYIAAVGIESFLHAQGIDTANIGMRPRTLAPGKGTSPYKAFLTELFEPCGLEQISPSEINAVIEKHKEYHHAPLRPLELNRQDFNDVSIDEMFEKGFNFVAGFEGSFSEKVDYLVKNQNLVPSVFRNFALYALFLNEALRPALQSKGIASEFAGFDVLNPDYLQGVIRENFSEEEQLHLIQQAEVITPHLVWDKKLQAVNYRGMVETINATLGGYRIVTNDEFLARMTQAQQVDERQRKKVELIYVPADFDSASFSAYRDYVPGGTEAYIDAVMTDMFRPALEAIFSRTDISLQEKLNHFENLYTYRSPQRRQDLYTILTQATFNPAEFKETVSLRSHISDRDLDKILTATPLEPEQLKRLSCLFYNSSLAEKHLLRALTIERDLDGERFEDLDYELERIVYYFEDFSFLRDDILKNLINSKRVSNPKKLRKIQALMLAYTDEANREKVQERMFNQNIIKLFLESRTGEKFKMEFLLWALGLEKKKPEQLTLLEYDYHINFDSLRTNLAVSENKYYRNTGQSAFEDMLESFLSGDAGILNSADTADIFLGKLFAAIIPDSIEQDRKNLLRDVYFALLNNASKSRQIDIVKRLLLTVRKIPALKVEEREAEVICAFLQASGFVFVKTGQFLESANLGIPGHIAQKLARLKGGAGSLAKAIVFSVLERVFGDFTGTFNELEDSKAAASIKDVYTLRLKEGTSIAEKFKELTVMAKIKRPEVDKEVEEEFQLLEKALSALRPTLQRKGIVLPANMLPSLKKKVNEELDFQQEQANQTEAQNNVARREMTVASAHGIFYSFMRRIVGMAKTKIEVVTAPVIRENMVMLEPRAKGPSLEEVINTNSNPAEIKEIKAACAEELLKEVFIDGRYHGDLHSQNIITVASDKVAFIDWGFMGRLSPQGQEAMIKLLLFLNRREIQRVPLLAQLLGVPNTAEIARVLAALPEDKVVITKRDVEEIIRSSGNMVEKMLRFFNLVERAGGTLPEEYSDLSKALGTAGYLFDALTWQNMGRVLLEMRLHTEHLKQTKKISPEGRPEQTKETFSSPVQGKEGPSDLGGVDLRKINIRKKEK